MHFYSKKSGRRKNWNIYYVGILSSIFLCAFGIKQVLSKVKLKEADGYLFIKEETFFLLFLRDATTAALQTDTTLDNQANQEASQDRQANEYHNFRGRWPSILRPVHGIDPDRPIRAGGDPNGRLKVPNGRGFSERPQSVFQTRNHPGHLLILASIRMQSHSDLALGREAGHVACQPDFLADFGQV